MQRLQQQLLERPVPTEQAAAFDEAKAGFKVPEGEKDYVHAYVTRKSGVAVPAPAIEPFHPAAYKALAKDPGFTAEIVHQPKAK